MCAERSEWPDCPVCGEPASSSEAQTETHQPGAMKPAYTRAGVITFECNRHSIAEPPVYFTAAGERVSRPPPDVTIKHGLL
jgi:hypothetical protein